MLQNEARYHIKVDILKNMDLLQLLFLELLIMLFEFTNFIYGIMVDFVCKVLWHFNLLFIQDLLDYFIHFPQREFEDVFTLEGREKLIACRGFIHSISKLQCNFYQQMPCFMCLEENILEIFHNIFLLEPAESTKLIE